MKSFLIRFLYGIALFFAISAPSWAGDSWQRINQTKTLRVAVALNAPWVIRQPDGQLVGHDVELASILAEDLGAKPEFIVVPFTGLIDAVTSGNADIAAAGLAITPERARAVTFSEPTGFQEISTVATPNAIDPIGAAGTLKKGSKVAALAGSTDLAAARSAWPDTQVTAYPSAAEAVAALVEGHVDALVATNPVPRTVASMYDARLRLVGGPLRRTPEAFAIAPDNERLIAFVNNWIEVRNADGLIRDVGSAWFDGHKWLRALEGSAAPETPTGKKK